LLQLAGIVIARRQVVDEPSHPQIDQARKDGHEALKRLTDQDFGYDVMRWYEYLITQDYGLDHPYAFTATLKLLKKVGFNAATKQELLARYGDSPGTS